MTMNITIADAMSNQRLFAEHFTGPSWSVWRAVLKAANAEPMSDTEKADFEAVAARQPPQKRVRELVAIVGRGGGKDFHRIVGRRSGSHQLRPRGQIALGRARLCVVPRV